jgi:hypothetical protein
MAVTRAYKVFGNGYDLASALKKFDNSRNIELFDNTVLSAASVKSMVPGLTEFKIAAEGIWKQDELNLDQIGNMLDAALAQSADGNLAWSELNTVGAAAYFAKFVQGSYNLPVEIGQLMLLSAEFTANELYKGLLGFPDQVCPSGATTSAAGIDHGDLTSKGLVWQGHAIGATGGVSTVLRLQHAETIAGIWVDLDVAPAIVGRGSFTRYIAENVPIDNVLRIQATPTGGTARCFAAHYRR